MDLNKMESGFLSTDKESGHKDYSLHVFKVTFSKLLLVFYISFLPKEDLNPILSCVE